jgi:1A family penicillin-binding protein
MSGRLTSLLAGIATTFYWVGFPLFFFIRLTLGSLFTLIFLARNSVTETYVALKRLTFPKKSANKKAKKPFVEKVAIESDTLYDWMPRWSVRESLVFSWHWMRREKSKSRFALAPISAPKPVHRYPIRPVYAVALSLVFVCIAGGAIFYQQILHDLPSPHDIRSRKPILSTKMYDRHGRLLYTLFKDENRTQVPLDQISPSLISATLAIEDADFHKHWGVSFRGIARAFVHNLQNETTQGGSTITQQLVKLTLLSPERTWQRKIREAVLALEVDQLYSKDEILSYYLNEVNYGGSVYGVEEASHWYFDKPASQLTLAESAFLAGLPVAPSAYSPFGDNPQRAYDRQREVLARMETVGAITPEQRQQAESEPIVFKNVAYDIKAPHFVMMVRSMLAERFGEDVVSQGGLEVYTTLDLDIQASAEAAVAAEVKKLGKLKVSNGAAMITDPRSGEILAMVGSKDYFDSSNDGSVNVPLRPRQPGSSIKPLTYALAFERGFTPSTMIEDSPVMYTAQGAPPYIPKNYDGRFHGRVSLRESLASSYNIPAVRLLVEVGVPTLVEKAKAMGITTWDDSSRFGLALTLGSGEVKMYDMMSVYGTFANGGLTVPLNPLMAVRSAKGEVMFSNPCTDSPEPCNARRTLSSLTAYQITSVLSDNQARSPAFGQRSALFIPNQEVAVKTGTTNSLRDNWTFGYTQDLVVGVWVGNNDNTPMSAVASGVTGASPIWNSIMKNQLAQGEKRTFALPVGLTKVKICRKTGTLPCAECPAVTEEVFPVGLAPTQSCNASMFVATEPAEHQSTAGR